MENKPHMDIVISAMDSLRQESRSKTPAMRVSANKPIRAKRNESSTKVSLRVNLPNQVHDRDPYSNYGTSHGRGNRDDEVEAWRDNAVLGSDDELSAHLHDLMSEQRQLSGQASVRAS